MQLRGVVGEGSPPHVRGKEEFLVKLNLYHRITPACAGKSCKLPALRRACRDHPRMCGEKWSSVMRGATFLGSPPHVRGKVFLCSIQQRLVGITPACAGKSGKIKDHGAAQGDHPRMCGEKRCS